MKKVRVDQIVTITVFCALFIAFTSCTEEGQQAWKPKSKFVGEFLKRERNIQALFSEEFVVENMKTKFRSAYRVEYDPSNKLNHFVSIESNDTLDSFKAYKRKGMWLLSRHTNDSLFTLQVIQIQDDLIIGWQDEFLQMLYIDELGAKDSLGLETTGAPFHWKVDRKVILDIYKDILTKSKPRYQIALKDQVAEPDESEDSEVNEAQEQIEAGNYIKNMYPMPAMDYLTLEMQAAGKYRVELVNKTGETLYENEWVGPEFTMNIDEVPSDTYILLLKDSKKSLLDSKQIVVSK